MPRYQPIPLTIYRPPAGKNSIPLDPADWPAMRRYRAVQVAVRRGVPEAEAIRRYDTPKGKCQVCGEASLKPLGTLCAGCLRDRRLEYEVKYYEARRVETKRPCKLCGAEFVIDSGRKYCDEHKGYVKPYIRKQRKQQVPTALQKFGKSARVRPPEKKVVAAEPPLVVVVPPEVHVRRFDSLGRECSEYPGLREGL